MCVCVCADHQLSPVQVVGSVACYNRYWNIHDVIDHQLKRKTLVLDTNLTANADFRGRVRFYTYVNI